MKNRLLIKTVISMVFFVVTLFCISACRANDTNDKNTNSSLVASSAEEGKSNDVVINYPDDGDDYLNLTYQDLLQKLDNIAESKRLDEIEYDYSKTVLNQVYENYDDWQNCGKDFPPKERFIRENIIFPLENCFLNFISTESDEGKRLLSNGSAMGFTDQFSDKAKVTILYEPDEDEENYLQTAERFLHELAHVRQKAVVFNDSHFNQYTYLRYLIIEGGATFKMKMMNLCQPEKMASGFVEKKNITLQYKMDEGNGYAKEMNYFCHLQYLAGYDVMEGVILGDSVGNIESSISERYGKETAKRILDLLKDLEITDLEEDYEKEFDYAVELENVFLDCLKKDIEMLKTRKEIEDFTNRYRAYMIHLLPRVYEDMYTEVTFSPEYFIKAKELDRMVADKIFESGSFGLKSLTASDSLIYTSTEHIYERPDDYYWVFTPASLYTVQFKEQDDGSLILSYENKCFEDNILVNILVNADRNKKEPEVNLLSVFQDEDIVGLKDFY